MFTTGATMSADEDWSSSCAMLNSVYAESRRRRLAAAASSTSHLRLVSTEHRVSCKALAICSEVEEAVTVALTVDS
jgi:hypothetical protein